MKMPTAAEAAKLKRGYLVGLAKENAPPDEGSLATFSLVAMRMRFAGLERPAALTTQILEPDPRPLIGEEARNLTLGLFAGKLGAAADQLGLAAARALSDADVRLHPFDFSQLQKFVIRHAALLGPAARSWAAHVLPSSKDSIQDAYAEIVTEETIGNASKALKTEFLMRMRRRDPARARAIIERIAPSEAATIRAELVGLLQIGLSEEDIPLLQTLLKDRAPSVRDKAGGLLARFPGTEQQEKNLALLRDHLKVTGTGILRRRKTLTVTSAGKKLDAITAVFANSRLEDMARGLDLDVETFVDAAAESAGIDALALASVINERRFALIGKFGDALKREDGRLALSLVTEALPNASGEERRKIVSACVRAETWEALPHNGALEQFYVVLGEALPVETAERLLRSSAWASVLKEGARPNIAGVADAVAPLIPRARSHRFITAVETISTRATLYHRLLLVLPESKDHGKN